MYRRSSHVTSQTCSGAPGFSSAFYEAALRSNLVIFVVLREDEVLDIQAHLPEEPNSFIGRERQLDELRRLVYSTRALTLCGPGGIGKTRLALRLLASMADEFPDGAWFVELADLRQPDLVISRVATALGVSEEPGRPLLETLADVLRRRRLLLALDNCEHLIDGCAQVARQLLASSPGLR